MMEESKANGPGREKVLPYQDVFQRYEKKYLLTPAQYEGLLAPLTARMKPDPFGESVIRNLYFDTPDYRLIRASLEKPVYKEKLRLRCYGMPEGQSPAFVELKKKYKGVVFKRRVDMPLAQAEDYLLRGRSPDKDGQIIREINWFMQYYPSLAPRMFIGYHRRAFYGLQDGGLRVTFDSQIGWRTQRLRLQAGEWGRMLLAPGQQLMEIKIPGAMPLWLARALGDLGIYPVSFSKYGQGFLAYQSNRYKEDDEACSICSTVC